MNVNKCHVHNDLTTRDHEFDTIVKIICKCVTAFCQNVILRQRHLSNRYLDDHLILWGGGGDWQIWSGQIIYFHHGARPENLFPRKLRTEYLFSIATNFCISKKKKMVCVCVGGGGLLVRGFSRGEGHGFLCFA